MRCRTRRPHSYELFNGIIMKCPSCGNELIWGGDHSYDDYGMEGEGIVSNSTCPEIDCDVESVLIYTALP